MISPPSVARARELYVDLLKRSLLGVPYFDNELRIRYLRQCLEGKASFDPAVIYDIHRHAPADIPRLAAAKVEGSPLDWNLENMGFEHTMLGVKRLENIEECFHSIVADDVPGDLIECGVWRGGGAVLMRGLLEAYEIPGRCVWVADSFQGLPPPTAAPDVAFGLDLSRKACPMLAVDRETVERTFDSYGLLDERVRFLEGWFKDTLAQAPIERLALLRMDGDIYESTMDIFHALYDKLSIGGYLVIDDLFVPTCRQAVNEFREARGIVEPILTIDWTGGYWRKGA